MGATGSAGFGTVPGLILAFYLTDTLGVAAGLASLVVLLPKIWDVFFLPFVGSLSDRTTARSNNRAGFLRIGAFGLLLSFPLMFAAPANTPPLMAAIWVLIAFLIAASAFGFFQVPYVALSAEITDSPAERTTLMAWRVGLQMLGILLFGIGAPVIVSTVDEGHAGYLLMGAVVGVLICAGMLTCWAAVRGLPRFATEPTSEAHGFVRQFHTVWVSRPFRILLVAFILQALGAGAALAAAPYFATQVLGVESFGIVFGVLLLPAVLVMPLWALIGHRLGKRRGYVLACCLFVAGLVGSLAASALPLALALLLLSVTSVGYAGIQLFPLALLPDVIDEEATRTGDQKSGSFTGMWTAAETAAFAIGPALVLIVLAVTGYASTTGIAVIQTDSAITGVRVAFSLLPAVLVAMSIPVVLRFHLREREVSTGTVQRSP